MSLVEKYRPVTLDELVGQVHLKNKIENLLSKDYLPHLMFVGDPGVGKTSLAQIIAKLKNYYLLEKNASDERGIDMVRNEVKQFARITTVESYNGKLILLDEADNLCLHPSTKILVDGLEKKIEEVLNKTFETSSYDFIKREKTLTRAKCIDSGMNFLYRVSLDDGKEIICSENQPFFARHGMVKKLKELELGEEIITFEEGFKTSKISRIRDFGKERAYDLVVPKYHNYITANGILTHNTLDSQAALRRTMEKYEKLTTFIFTINRPERIIDPIKSRCTILNFRRLPDTEILKRILYILKKEGISVDTKKPKIVLGLKELLKYSNGDMRTALNTLESIITKDHEITEESILLEEKPQGVLTMLEYAAGGDFEKARDEVQRIYVQDRFGIGSIVDEVYKSLGELDGLSEEAKIKVYEKLGELERNLKLGTNPLIQLTSFLAFLWVVQYVKVPAECPLSKV